MADVCERGEQPEHGAQDVLTLGDPRDGFDIHGMQREERGDGEAVPESAGHPAEQCEEQQHVCGVEKDVHSVHRAWVEAEDGHIKHERKPREREPLPGIEMRERPAEIFAAQARGDVRVVEDVARVVVADKIETPHRTVREEHCDGEDKAGEQRPFSVGHGRFSSKHGAGQRARGESRGAVRS